MNDTAKRESIQARIEKLLAKAESTDSPHEAEALSAKAEALMIEWGIEAAMLDAGRTQADREKVTEDSMGFTGRYASAMTLFGSEIARAMGLRPLESYYRGQSNRRRLILIGHASDVARAQMLITSLHMQAQTALRVWWKGFDYKAHMTPSEKFQSRRQFLVSFANAAAERLTAQRAEQEAAKQADQDSRTYTGEKQADIGPGVALVLANRQHEVTAYMAQHYPRTGRGRGMQGSVFGGAEGAAAGHAANLGNRSSVGNGARAALAG